MIASPASASTLRLAKLITLTSLLPVPAIPSAFAQSVGFQRIAIPTADGGTLTGAIWYPTEANPSAMALGAAEQVVARNAAVAGHNLPFVVISHGTFGGVESHADLAAQLAQAGFVAVAASYAQFSADGVLRTGNWTSGIRDSVDYVLTRWPDHARIDRDRIGAFGFSVGGFATLVAVGGQPDPSRIPPHCKAAPTDWSCMLAGKIDLARTPPPPPSAWIHDTRIKAAVLAVPAMGYVFGRHGLAAVHAPILLWEAGDDHTLPPAWNSAPIITDLPAKPEMRMAQHADHADFTAPCAAKAAAANPTVCGDPTRFDRAAFHTIFDATIVSFFKKVLRVER